MRDAIRLFSTQINFSQPKSRVDLGWAGVDLELGMVGGCIPGWRVLKPEMDTSLRQGFGWPADETQIFLRESTTLEWG
jgi:hypothetical protein